MMLAFLVSYLTLPILVAGVFVARKRRSLSRPRLFLFGGILEGYLCVAGVLFWVLQPFATIGIAGVAPGDPAAMEPIAGFGRFIAGLPIAAIAQLFTLWVTHRGTAKANAGQ
jgi:hypothetical protein